MEWYKLLDPSTNLYFYSNPKTGQCSWKRPTQGTIVKNELPEWWEMFDADSELPYYYNNVTQETIWELPEDMAIHPTPLSSDDDAQIRNVLGPAPPDAEVYSENDVELDDDWETSEDPRTGHNYYLHRRTRKLTWSKLDAVRTQMVMETKQLQTMPHQYQYQAAQAQAQRAAQPPVPNPAPAPVSAPAPSVHFAPIPATNAAPIVRKLSTVSSAAPPHSAAQAAPAALAKTNIPLPPSNPSSSNVPLNPHKSMPTKIPPLPPHTTPPLSTSPPPANSLLSVNPTSQKHGSAPAAGRSPSAGASTVPKLSTKISMPNFGSPQGGAPGSAVSPRSVQFQLPNPAPSTTAATSPPLSPTGSVTTPVASGPVSPKGPSPRPVLTRTATAPPEKIKNMVGGFASAGPAAAPPASPAYGPISPRKENGTVSPPKLQASSPPARDASPPSDDSISRQPLRRAHSSRPTRSSRLSIFLRPLPAPGGPTSPRGQTSPRGGNTSPRGPTGSNIAPRSGVAPRNEPGFFSPPNKPLPALPVTSLRAQDSRLSARRRSRSVGTLGAAPAAQPPSVPVAHHNAESVIDVRALSPPSSQTGQVHTSVRFAQPPQVAKSGNYTAVSQQLSPRSESQPFGNNKTVAPKNIPRTYSTSRNAIPPLLTPPATPAQPTLTVAPRYGTSVSSPSLVNKNSSPAEPNTSKDEQTSPRDPMPARPSRAPSMLHPGGISEQLQKEINFFQLEGFAAKYFKTGKKGVFRRLVPVRELLKWSKDSLPTSLLKFQKKDLTKAAISLFKQVQIFMGDRTPGISQSDRYVIGQKIIDKCIFLPELRDELFCILCKQTCMNPSSESLYRGWDLMCLALQYFPPTKDLESWLQSYFDENRKFAGAKRDDKLDKYVAYAAKKLPIICRDGARNVSPELAEVERAVLYPIHPPIFGGTLDDVMSYQKNNPDMTLPLVLTSLISLLQGLKAHTQEGIFRVPGNMPQVTAMKLQIEAQNYKFTDTDANTPASVLKLWCRTLEEPIIPPNAYWKAIEAGKSDSWRESCRIVNEDLPDLNKRIVIYLISYLQVVALPQNQQINKMGIVNLAIVFGPSLLRSPASDPVTILESQKYEQIFLTHLIKHLDTQKR